MNTINSKIEGVFIEKINEIKNPKGSIYKILNKNTKGFKKFGECYISELHSGSIKGWKIHLKQTQNISVPEGKIKLILVDLRKSSSTFNTFFEIVIAKPDNLFRITIPPNVAYAFQSLSVNTSLILNCTDLEYDASENKTLPLDDISIPFTWKI